MLLVRGVSGPESARVGQTVTYRVTAFNHTQPDPAETAKVAWLVQREDGMSLTRAPSQGPTFELLVPEAWSGFTVLVMPHLRSPTTQVAVRTTIARAPAEPDPGTPRRVEITREASRFYASVDDEPPFYLGTRVSYGARRGLMNWINAPGPRFDPADFESVHADWGWYLLPTVMCESRGYFTCLNTYDRACFTFGPSQLGAHTPDDNFVLFLRELLAQPLAAAYFPDLMVLNGRIHRRQPSGPVPLESADETSGLMNYFNATPDEVDDDEANKAARMVDWCLRSPAARELQVRFAVQQHRRKLAVHARRLPLHGVSDRLCLVVLDILHQGRAAYRSIETALASAGPFDALLSLGASTYRERIATLRGGIQDLEARQKVGAKVYDAETGEFVVPVEA
jgi:hypothetical protein